MKTKVFISTASIHQTSNQEGTGDIDYAKTLSASFQENGQDAEFLLSQHSEEEEVYNYIYNDSNKSANPILHILINAPGLGTAFSRKGIESFKEKGGGKVVITVVEFVRGNMKDEHRALALENIDLAEEVIFLDDNDKKRAIEFNKTRSTISPYAAAKNKILEESLVIPTPATVDVISKSQDEKGGDILSFGMIRKGKGFNKIINLAKLIKESKDGRINTKKILIVGTIQIHNDGGVKALAEEILVPLYPSNSEEILNISRQDLSTEDNRKRVASELKTFYENTLKQTTTFPVELHFDVEESKLGELFDRCSYSFLPAYRGATLRNTSITTSITQKLITYSGLSDVTPNILREGQEYDGAVILKNNPKMVFDDILKREGDKILNAQTRTIQTKLVEEKISREAVAKKHIEVFSKIRFPEKSESETKPPVNIEDALNRLTGIEVAGLEKHEKLFVYHLFLESREEIKNLDNSNNEKSRVFAEYFNNKINAFFEYLDDKKLEKLRVNVQSLETNFETIETGFKLTKDYNYTGKDQWFRVYGHHDNFVSDFWKIDDRLELEMRHALNIKKTDLDGLQEELFDKYNPLVPGPLFGKIEASTPGLIMTALRLGINSTRVIAKNFVRILDCKQINATSEKNK